MGILYSVATPIGNLADITLRALTVLREVDGILCEDTRVTRKLLNHYDITTPTRSYHQHSSPAVSDQIIQQLVDGQNLAMVTDAGTPGISDPGNLLVHKAIAAGITVVPIPGVTAVITALQVAGVDTSRFVYLGFIPHKKGRQTMLTVILNETRTVVVYESPHRLLKTLDSLRQGTRMVIVARELTKLHEEIVRGTAEEVYQAFVGRSHIKGECVVVVHN